MIATFRALIAAVLLLTLLPATTVAQEAGLPYLVIETPGGESLPAVHLQLEPGDSDTVPLRLATTTGVEATLRNGQLVVRVLRGECTAGVPITPTRPSRAPSECFARPECYLGPVRRGNTRDG